MNCYDKTFARFVDFIFFINVFGTTLSYAVLIQGNMVTSFAFLRSKYWTNMPNIMDDPDSVFWVVFFAVAIQ
jgi:amino acid permease